MKFPEIKKVAISIRVSTKRQKEEGISLEVQLSKIKEEIEKAEERLKRYAGEQKWEIYDIYIDVESAKNIKGRKDFQRLLRDAIDHKFDAVIVTKYDRAFRNAKEALITIDELAELGIRFISTDEDINIYTSNGRMVFTILMAVAEHERERDVERVEDIQLYKFEKGLMVGKPSYGYKYSKEKGKFTITPKQAEIIKDIYHQTLLGELNWEEICKKHKLSMRTYYNILKNKTYIGIITYKGQEKKGTQETVIDENTFNAVQNKLKKKKGENNATT